MRQNRKHVIEGLAPLMRNTTFITQPEFVRVPRVGERCPVCSLPRTKMNQLIQGPNAPVKSVVVRQRGTNRGIRLVVVESLLSHLHGLAEEQSRKGGVA
jgi:hypothetical protein